MQRYAWFVVLVVAIVGFPSLTGAQTVTNVQHTLANGVRVVTVKGWHGVSVSSSEADVPNTDRGAVEMAVYDQGDLLGPDWKADLSAADAAAPIELSAAAPAAADLAPGIYTARVSAPLAGQAGSFTFRIDGIHVDTGRRTSLRTLVRDAEVTIETSQEPRNGAAWFQVRAGAHRWDGDAAGAGVGYPALFPAGDHANEVQYLDRPNDITGVVAAGTYDLRIDVDVSPAGVHFVTWVEGLSLGPDTSTKVFLNLNAGSVRFEGDPAPSILHFYRRGSAAKLGSSQDQRLELYHIESPRHLCAVPPGTYDILYDYGYGERLVWSPDVRIPYGKVTVLGSPEEGPPTQ